MERKATYAHSMQECPFSNFPVSGLTWFVLTVNTVRMSAVLSLLGRRLSYGVRARYFSISALRNMKMTHLMVIVSKRLGRSIVRLDVAALVAAASVCFLHGVYKAARVVMSTIIFDLSIAIAVAVFNDPSLAADFICGVLTHATGLLLRGRCNSGLKRRYLGIVRIDYPFRWVGLASRATGPSNLVSSNGD